LIEPFEAASSETAFTELLVPPLVGSVDGMAEAGTEGATVQEEFEKAM
jgi:hypothetical protein